MKPVESDHRDKKNQIMRENEGNEMYIRESELWAVYNLDNKIQIMWSGVGANLEVKQRKRTWQHIFFVLLSLEVILDQHV